MTSVSKTHILKLGMTAALLIGFIFPVSAQDTKAGIDRTEIETIVREYLLANPEILLDVQTKLQEKQEMEMASAQKTYLQSNNEKITTSAYHIEIGNPEAKKTVVEFFDYNCGYCQRALSDMQAMLEQDKDVRFILKEYPVLGESSLEASRVSMAFSQLKPELHAQFHMDLLALEGEKNGKRAMEIAIQMGANEKDLEAEMENPLVMDAIQINHEIATNLGITGTPSYIVGDEVIFGAVGVSELTKQVNELSQ